MVQRSFNRMEIDSHDCYDISHIEKDNQQQNLIYHKLANDPISYQSLSKINECIVYTQFYFVNDLDPVAYFLH